MPNPLLQRIAPDASREMDGQWLRTAYQESSRALQESKGGDATFYEIGANAPHMLPNEWYFKSFYEGIFYGWAASRSGSRNCCATGSR